MYAPGYALTIPPMVSVFNREVGWVTERLLGSVPVSATFESADRAVYVPIVLPASCVVRRVWWANGTSVSASYNVDVGIYADSNGPAAKIISSGSTAQGTASEVQFVDVTDTALPPGVYWIAITCSDAAATFARSVLGSSNHDAALRMQEASALPLPATATAVESAALNIYLCGFSTTASP